MWMHWLFQITSGIIPTATSGNGHGMEAKGRTGGASKTTQTSSIQALVWRAVLGSTSWALLGSAVKIWHGAGTLWHILQSHWKWFKGDLLFYICICVAWGKRLSLSRFRNPLVNSLGCRIVRFKAQEEIQSGKLCMTEERSLRLKLNLTQRRLVLITEVHELV